MKLMQRSHELLMLLNMSMVRSFCEELGFLIPNRESFFKTVPSALSRVAKNNSECSLSYEHECIMNVLKQSLKCEHLLYLNSYLFFHSSSDIAGSLDRWIGAIEEIGNSRTKDCIPKEILQLANCHNNAIEHYRSHIMPIFLDYDLTEVDELMMQYCCVNFETCDIGMSICTLLCRYRFCMSWFELSSTMSQSTKNTIGEYLNHIVDPYSGENPDFPPNWEFPAKLMWNVFS